MGEELEFISHWLDHYLDKGNVVAFITEFLEEQERAEKDTGP